MTSKFVGFTPKTTQFLKNLKKNNTKEWFKQHKPDFDEYVMNPAKDFVTIMGERLQELSPNIIAVPKTDRSIFRIYRDTRFSADKSPYKTHLGIFFWEGTQPKMECPGFYFHLEPPNLMLGGGLYMFPPTILEHYRHAVVHSEYGAELTDIVKKLGRQKNYNLGGKHYKRIPTGFDATHINADLLLHKGMYVGIEEKIPDELYSEKLIDFCINRYEPMAALHQWLVTLNRSAGRA